MSRTNVLILIAAILSGIAGFVISRIYYSPQSLNERHLSEERAQTLPDMDFPVLDGSRLTAASLKGKATLINFWATWCAPCRREMPALIEAQETLDTKHATIVGIAIDDEEPVRSFMKELGVNYPVALADLLAATELADQFGNPRLLLPFSVFVSPDGVIENVHLGELSKDQVIAGLKQLGY